MTAGVYLIRAENGLVKIGCSTGIERRLMYLQTGTPHELTLLGVIETDHPRELERQLHKRFADRRRRGEWFELSEDEIISARAYGGPMTTHDPPKPSPTTRDRAFSCRIGRALGTAARQVDQYTAAGDTADAERWEMIVERLFEVAMDYGHTGNIPAEAARGRSVE
jgi:hypothetical protein